MKTISELHDRAMELADMALLAQRKRDVAGARKFNQEAFELERQAALYVSDLTDAEPTRSILLRSAATLALECGERREAQKLLATAFLGDPPAEIAEELFDLFEQVHFERHLNVRGAELTQDEVQIALAGHAIAPGLGPTDALLDRIGMFTRAFYRVAERLVGAGFAEFGDRRLRHEFMTYLGVPRLGSFAMSFKVTRLQQHLFANISPANVLEDLLACIEIYNSEDETRLRRMIGNDEYFKNFVGIARKLQPDGFDIKAVAFTAVLDGDYSRTTSLTKPRNSIRPVYRPTTAHEPLLNRADAAPQVVTLTGRLKAASSRNRSIIQLVEGKRNVHTVIVPKAMMNDIVRPMWDRVVTVTGVMKNGKIYMDDINPAK